MAFPEYVDIARFQHTSNDVSYFKHLLRNDAKGTFVQLNYGAGYPNPFAGEQLRLSLKYLQFTGIYAFFLGDPVNEAKYFLAQAHMYRMDDDLSTPVMLDVEPNSSYNGPQTHLINQWTNIIYRYGFHNIYIYSPSSWLNDGHVKSEKLRHGHIWAASYGTDAPGVMNARAWQFTDNWCGMHTDGDMLFAPVSTMTGKASFKSKHPMIKHHKQIKPKVHYLTKGSYFEAISDLNGYCADNLEKKNGDFLPKGSRFHGQIVGDGYVKRIKCGLGYFSANSKLVKSI